MGTNKGVCLILQDTGGVELEVVHYNYIGGGKKLKQMGSFVSLPQSLSYSYRDEYHLRSNIKNFRCTFRQDWN